MATPAGPKKGSQGGQDWRAAGWVSGGGVVRSMADACAQRA